MDGRDTMCHRAVDVAMPVVLTPLKPPVYHEEQMFL